MPRKVFTAGEVLAAADVNEFLMDQAVQSFAGTAARGSAIPSPVTGMTTYLEDTEDLRIWNGTSYQAPFGLTLVKSQTIGTSVTSVVVADVFSAQYDNYRIIVSGGSASDTVALNMVLGATTTGYYYGGVGRTYAGAGVSIEGSNVAFWYTGESASAGHTGCIEVQNPFNSRVTSFSSALGALRTGAYSLSIAGFLNNTTSYTGFTFNAVGGNVTGGKIDIYGYKRS
jgi:hypothetical protein